MIDKEFPTIYYDCPEYIEDSEDTKQLVFGMGDDMKFTLTQTHMIYTTKLPEILEAVARLQKHENT